MGQKCLWTAEIKQKHGELSDGAHFNRGLIFATFYVTSRLHEQFFVFDSFYLSDKS